jgi:hypothetical protein
MGNFFYNPPNLEVKSLKKTLTLARNNGEFADSSRTSPNLAPYRVL